MAAYLDRARERLTTEVGQYDKPPQVSDYDYGYSVGRSAGILAARLVRYMIPHGTPSTTVMYAVFNGLTDAFRDSLGERLSP